LTVALIVGIGVLWAAHRARAQTAVNADLTVTKAG
jgi:hypothetical protein